MKLNVGLSILIASLRERVKNNRFLLLTWQPRGSTSIIDSDKIFENLEKIAKVLKFLVKEMFDFGR